jgi:uncharacterized protein YgiM (DUF1202 family)
MRTVVKWLFTLALMVTLSAGCASAKQTSREKKNKEDAPEQPQSQAVSEIPSSLLPTLTVGVDSCYVFLEPDHNSSFFGPLKKGEKIKRLDAEGEWLRVWIPRLRFPGWVRKHKVYVGKSEDANQTTVSIEFLASVNILKEQVNIREEATLGAPIILKAKQRQEFYVLDEKDDWYQIWIPHLNKKGWVHGKVVVKQRKG